MGKKSSFSLVKTEIFFHIAPMYANNLESGIKEQLVSNYLLKYSDLFCGVPLSFQRIAFDEKSCEIFHENPFLHIHATVEFVVFTPKTGDLLQLAVNKISESHVGGLAFGFFNVSISEESLREHGFASWDSETGTWLSASTGEAVGVGSQLWFEVDWVKHGNEVLVICGKNPHEAVY